MDSDGSGGCRSYPYRDPKRGSSFTVQSNFVSSRVDGVHQFILGGPKHNSILAIEKCRIIIDHGADPLSPSGEGRDDTSRARTKNQQTKCIVTLVKLVAPNGGIFTRGQIGSGRLS